MVRIDITRDNECPSDCPYYGNRGNEYYEEWCSLPDGKYVIEVKEGKLVKCPLGKW